MAKLAQKASILFVLAWSAMNAGCLVKDTAHSVSMEPDGSATWTVLDRNVHATGGNSADRLSEEEDYLAVARSGQDPNALAMRGVGALDVTTQIVSARWPYAALTEARFANVAAMLQNCFDATGGIRGRSVLQPDGTRITWRIAVTQDESVPSTRPREIENAVASLLGGLLDGKGAFFLRHGQFVEADGFTITDDGRVATPNDLSNWDWEANPRLELSLTWTDKEASSR